MRRHLHFVTAVLFAISLLFVAPATVLADEGEDIHGLEVIVDGYHVVLSSQEEWQKGENLIVVSIADSMGMPVAATDVELLIAPGTDEHEEPEADSHGSSSSHGSMTAVEEEPDEHDTSEAPEHDEQSAAPIFMDETHDTGIYRAETHLDASGEYEVQVLFHIDGEMLQADFNVEVHGSSSKTVVLWSFLLINVGLVSAAGVLRKQSPVVKGVK